MQTILYQAYGSQDIKNELLFSLVSLLPYTVENQYQIIIYTDDEAYFQRPFLSDLRLVFQPLTPERIIEWQGEDKFVHRLKIKLIEDFLERGGTTGLYLDTDTVFTKNPKPLFEAIREGKFWMHLKEGPIQGSKNPLFQKITRFIQNNREHVEDLPYSKAFIQMMMYNAGLIGFDYRLDSHMSEILKLNDGLYELYPKHIMEQLAFSLVLQQNFDLLEAHPYVFHYWNLKEIRPLLKKFFEKYGQSDTPTIFSKSVAIQPEILVSAKAQLLDRKRNQVKKLLGIKTRYKAPDLEELIPMA